jgi:hypothetical protein
MGNIGDPWRAINMIAMGLLAKNEELNDDKICQVIEKLEKRGLDLTPGDRSLFLTTLYTFLTFSRDVIERRAPDAIEKYLCTEEGKKIHKLLSEIDVNVPVTSKKSVSNK